MKEYPVEFSERGLSTEYYIILFALLTCLVLLRIYLAKQKGEKAKAAEYADIEEIANRAHFLLIDSLQMMALPYEEQKKLLPDFVDAPFEVVDDFDNAYRILYALIKTGRVTQEQVDAIGELHKLVEQIDWKIIYELDESEITNYPTWAATRNQAIVVLQKLGAPMQPPTGNGKVYVIGNED